MGTKTDTQTISQNGEPSKTPHINGQLAYDKEGENTQW